MPANEVKWSLICLMLRSIVKYFAVINDDFNDIKFFPASTKVKSRAFGNVDKNFDLFRNSNQQLKCLKKLFLLKNLICFV